MSELRELRPERFSNHACSKYSNFHSLLLVVPLLPPAFLLATLAEKAKLNDATPEGAQRALTEEQQRGQPKDRPLLLMFSIIL